MGLHRDPFSFRRRPELAPAGGHGSSESAVRDRVRSPAGAAALGPQSSFSAVQGRSLAHLLARAGGGSTAAWTERPTITEKLLSKDEYHDSESFAVVSGGWKLVHNVICTPRHGRATSCTTSRRTRSLRRISAPSISWLWRGYRRSWGLAPQCGSGAGEAR